MNISLYSISSFLVISVLAGFTQISSSCTKQPLISVKDTSKTWLALGDSYTIGQSVAYDQNYPQQTVKILSDLGIHFASPEIIATTGWTTGDLLNAIAGKPVPTFPYDIVTLLIGVNNQYQGLSMSEYQTQFTTLLERSIAYAGNKASHVIVISIPDYAATPYGESTGDSTNISYQINAFNAINKQVSLNYGVKYINVTDASRKASTDRSLIAADGLHYTGKEYKIWSVLLADLIRQIVN
jgi:lysophospholipase L1-like esterase